MKPSESIVSRVIGLFARPDFVKFVIVGCVNTVVTLIVLWSLVELLQWPMAPALALTWVAGVLFNYSLNSVWSFRLARWPVFDMRFVRYTLVYVAGYCLNLALLTWLVDGIGLAPMVGQFSIMPVIVIFNYLGARFWAVR